MNYKLKEKISKIYSLLSADNKTKDILELKENSDNRKIIEYLDRIGAEEFVFEITDKMQLGSIKENGGVTYLWYKRNDGVWIIKLWEINRIKK